MKPPAAFSFRGQRALILRVPVRLLHSYGPGAGSEQDGDDLGILIESFPFHYILYGKTPFLILNHNRHKVYNKQK